MNASCPPRFATWLLQRSASGPKRESLVGDLIEQYRHGRSSGWYWRQVLVAIGSGALADIGHHKLLAVRAVVVGWVLYFLLSFPVNWLTGVVGIWVNEWLVQTRHYGLFWWHFWGFRLPSMLLVYIACAMSGWTVARLHSRHSAAMVGLFGVTVFLFEYGFISWSFLRHGYPPSVSQAELVIPAVLAINRPLWILIGGLLGSRPTDDDATGPIPVQ